MAALPDPFHLLEQQAFACSHEDTVVAEIDLCIVRVLVEQLVAGLAVGDGAE